MAAEAKDAKKKVFTSSLELGDKGVNYFGTTYSGMHPQRNVADAKPAETGVNKSFTSSIQIGGANNVFMG